jgi:hypothetical protein
METVGTAAGTSRAGHAVLTRSRRSPEILWGSIGLFLLAAGLLVTVMAPGLLAAAPRCLFKVATGWPCPTCGATRALWALGAGHPLEALAWNPLLGLAALGGSLYLPYAWLVVGGVITPIRTGWLTPPMPRTLRWLVPAALALNWIYLLLAGA